MSVLRKIIDSPLSAIGLYWRRVQGLQWNVRRYLWSTVFFAVNTSLTSLLLNLYLTSLGFDAAFIGLNSAVLSGARLISALPAGMIADRLGRKLSMVLGLLGMALAQLAVVTLTRGWMIVGAYLFSGIVGTLYMTSVAPFLTENSSPEQRAILFTLDSGLMNASSFVTSVVGGYLPGLFALLMQVDAEGIVAYRCVLLAAVGATFLASLPILTLKEARDPSSVPQARLSLRIRGNFSNPRRMVQLVLPRVLMAFGAGLIFPFLNLFFKERFAVTDASLGWIFGITNIFAAAALLGGGVIADRLGKLRAMFYARLLSLPGLLVIGFVPVLPIVVAAHWLRSGLMRLGEPLYMAFAMEQLSEEERATGSSMLSTGWNVGWSTGPYVSGLLQPHLGWEALFIGTILFYTTGLVCTYQFFMRPSMEGRSTTQT